MKIRISRSHLTQYEKVFYVLWAVFTLAFFFLQMSEIYYMYSTSELYQNITKTVAVCLFVLVLSTRRYRIKEFIAYLVVGIVFAISTILLRDSYLFVLCAIIVAGAKIDFDKFVRFDIKLKILALVVIVGLCEFGILNNYTAIMNGSYKQALGFSHPNSLSALVITILIEWIYIRYKKFNIIDFIGILLCVYCIYSIAASRSSVYTFVFVFIIMLMLKAYPRILNSRIVREVFALLTVISAGLSFFLVSLYSRGTAIGIALNQILTTRLKVAYLWIQEYGFSLFGQSVSSYGTRTRETSTADLFSVDMAYIAIPVKYGVFLLILFFVGYYIMTKKVAGGGKCNLLIAITFFVLFGIGETYIYRIQYNFTLVIILAYVRDSLSGSKRRIPP